MNVKEILSLKNKKVIMKKIKKKMRIYFGIPKDIPLKWALIEETIAGESTTRPALVIDCNGHKLALDILQCRFLTESTVLSCSHRILDVKSVTEGDAIVLTCEEEGYSQKFTEQDIDEIYFVRYFSLNLFDRVANGGNLV